MPPKRAGRKPAKEVAEEAKPPVLAYWAGVVRSAAAQRDAAAVGETTLLYSRAGDAHIPGGPLRRDGARPWLLGEILRPAECLQACVNPAKNVHHVACPNYTAPEPEPEPVVEPEPEPPKKGARRKGR